MGICYGFQAMAQALGGRVERTTTSEFGRTPVKIQTGTPLTEGLAATPRSTSHGDAVTPGTARLCVGRQQRGGSSCRLLAADRRLAGVQWHPRSGAQRGGQQLLTNFLYRIAGLEPDWTSEGFVAEQVAAIREQVGDRQVLCGLSGGVDSAVAAALVQRAIGDQLDRVFVDHGLLRKGEASQVEQDFVAATGVRLVVVVDEKQRFLTALAGVRDPDTGKLKIVDASSSAASSRRASP